MSFSESFQVGCPSSSSYPSEIAVLVLLLMPLLWLAPMDQFQITQFFIQPPTIHTVFPTSGTVCVPL